MQKYSRPNKHEPNKTHNRFQATNRCKTKRQRPQPRRQEMGKSSPARRQIQNKRPPQTRRRGTMPCAPNKQQRASSQANHHSRTAQHKPQKRPSYKGRASSEVRHGSAPSPLADFLLWVRAHPDAMRWREHHQELLLTTPEVQPIVRLRSKNGRAFERPLRFSKKSKPHCQ